MQPGPCSFPRHDDIDQNAPRHILPAIPRVLRSSHEGWVEFGGRPLRLPPPARTPSRRRALSTQIPFPVSSLLFQPCLAVLAPCMYRFVMCCVFVHVFPPLFFLARLPACLPARTNRPICRPGCRLRYLLKTPDKWLNSTQGTNAKRKIQEALAAKLAAGELSGYEHLVLAGASGDGAGGADGGLLAQGGGREKERQAS